MPVEKLTHHAISPVEQRFETGCVPTSISMVLSGFGVNISEEALIDRYFPTARLPRLDRNSGVKEQNTVECMVRILEDLRLQKSLQLDVFDPYLCNQTSSPEEKYIIKSTPDIIAERSEKFGKDSPVGDTTEMRDFYKSLEKLLKNNKIGVYTANARMMDFSNNFMFLVSDHIKRGFYGELADFVRKGHIVGPHGGGTAHVRALDGTKTTDQCFWIVDPDGRSYSIPHSSLIWLDSEGTRGDTFDYLFRLSPKEEVPNPQQYKVRSFLQGLRRFSPKAGK